MPIPDFHKRLLVEREELNSKIIKLSDFLNGCFQIDAVQLALLKVQLQVMCTYRHILDQRLDLIK